MRRMRTGRDAAPAGSASSAGLPGASGVTARPNYVGPSVRAGGADERRAKTLRDQGDLANGSFHFQKAVRGRRKNAAVKRRKARRPASWAGRSLPLEGRPCRKAGHRVRRSAPALVGASPPRTGGMPQGGRAHPPPERWRWLYETTRHQRSCSGEHFGENEPEVFGQRAFWQNEPESSAQHFSAPAGMIAATNQE